MTLITKAPLGPLLDRLFAQAEAIRPETLPIFAQTPPAERDRLMRSKDDWRLLYGALKDMPLPVSREAGRLLYMLVRACGARAIVEFGTSFGLSTLHLAAALRDNGGGCLITTEFEPGKVARASAHLEESGLADLVEIGLAMRWKHWLATCQGRSISSCSMGPRRSISMFWP
jgi:predicted O-methyltransferase YrrM